MKVVIHRQKTDDLRDFLLEAWQEADKEHYGKTLAPETFTKHTHYLEATEGRDRAGLLILETQAGIARIADLVVISAYRRKGVGRRLVAEAEKLAKESNCHKIYLETGKHWEAVQFYRALGYEAEALFKNDSLHQDFIRFYKFL